MGWAFFGRTPLPKSNWLTGKNFSARNLQTEINADTGVESIKFKVGNMEDGPAFRWIEAKTIRSTIYPKDAFVLERLTNMNYYGFLRKSFSPLPLGEGPGVRRH